MYPQGTHCGPLLFIIFINDLKFVILYADFLLYADDLKLFRIIKNIADAMRLQTDIDRINEWCKANGLMFSISKCSCISFSKKEPVNFEYTIGGELLNRVEVIKDLGVTYECDLNFSSHIMHITNKASKNLYFLLRFGTEFRNPTTLTTVYLSLVRSGLSYASVVWSPYTDVKSNLLESVQHRFLRSLAYKMNEPMGRFDHDYYNVASKSGICSLKSFRNYQDSLFLYKLLHGYIDSPWLLSKVNLRIPGRRLRTNQNTFVIDPRKPITLMHSSPIDRTSNLLNMIASDIDLNFISISKFKNLMKRTLSQYE